MAQRGPLPRISQGWNQGTIWAMFSSEGLTGEAFTSTSSGSLVELISCDCRTEATALCSILSGGHSQVREAAPSF